MKKITPPIIAGFVLLLSLACSTIEISLDGKPAFQTFEATKERTLNPQEKAEQYAAGTATAVAMLPTIALPTVEPPKQLIHVAGDTVKFALIALEDNGVSGEMIGCGDSVVLADVHYDPSYDPLEVAFMGLLNVGEKYYGQSGLYNALYPSSLMIESLSYEGGTVFIHLTGTLMVGGTCDIPRIEAQFMKTALQFPELSGAQIFINGTPLAELLSLK